MSMTHEAVSRAVKKLGLNSEAQHNAGYGLPLVDVAIEARDQEKDIAMMVSEDPLYAACLHAVVEKIHNWQVIPKPFGCTTSRSGTVCKMQTLVSGLRTSSLQSNPFESINSDQYTPALAVPMSS